MRSIRETVSVHPFQLTLKTLRTHLRKWTHQCDETQGNNSTQVFLTKIVFFGCKKRDSQRKKKEAKKRTDKKELMYKNIKNDYQ